jgi:hypothetical protein
VKAKRIDKKIRVPVFIGVLLVDGNEAPSSTNDILFDGSIFVKKNGSLLSLDTAAGFL